MKSDGQHQDDADDDTTPLWKYVTKLDKTGIGGGNCRFQCNLCHLTFMGSYTRVKSHLLRVKGHGIRGCSKVTPRDVQEMKGLMDEFESRTKKGDVGLIPLPPPPPHFAVNRSQSSSSSAASSRFGAPGIDSFMHDGFEPRKRKAVEHAGVDKGLKLAIKELLDSEIARMFYSAGLPFQLARSPYYISSYSFAANNQVGESNCWAKEHLDKEIARMFYSAGLSFQLSRNPFFISSFSLAANNLFGDYKPPNENALKVTLLRRERENIERFLEPTKGTWGDKGVSIAVCGGPDAQKGSVINFMAVVEDKPIFLKAINFEGNSEDKYFIANLINKIIVEVGPDNVVQVITGNDPVYREVGLHVEAQYPHIFWTPCVVHSINLVLRNICEAKDVWVDDVTYDECSWIRNLIEDAVILKNFFTNHPMRLAIFNRFVDLKPLLIAETRFASMIVLLKRLSSIKNGLQDMVNSDTWVCFEDDVQKAEFLKEKVLDSTWWEKIDYVLSFTGPLYEMLRVCIADKPCLHLLCHMWDTMIEKVKSVVYQHEGRQDDEESTFYLEIQKILVDGKNKSIRPLHCLAHSLNPRYYTTMWLNQGPGRVAPHKDKEISDERNKCMKRYCVDPEERRKVREEFAKFSAALDAFADNDSMDDRGAIDPKSWWIVYGSSAPTLQNIAMKLLGQPCSLSCCERNWSTYSIINCIYRKNIKSQCARDLLFVHTNLRLLSRRNQHYMEGETMMWDVSADAFDCFSDVGVLEFADLSLDEPELEVRELSY